MTNWWQSIGGKDGLRQTLQQRLAGERRDGKKAARTGEEAIAQDEAMRLRCLICCKKGNELMIADGSDNTDGHDKLLFFGAQLVCYSAKSRRGRRNDKAGVEDSAAMVAVNRASDHGNEFIGVERDRQGSCVYRERQLGKDHL